MCAHYTKHLPSLSLLEHILESPGYLMLHDTPLYSAHWSKFLLCTWTTWPQTSVATDPPVCSQAPSLFCDWLGKILLWNGMHVFFSISIFNTSRLIPRRGGDESRNAFFFIEICCNGYNMLHLLFGHYVCVCFVYPSVHSHVCGGQRSTGSVFLFWYSPSLLSCVSHWTWNWLILLWSLACKLWASTSLCISLQSPRLQTHTVHQVVCCLLLCFVLLQKKKKAHSLRMSSFSLWLSAYFWGQWLSCRCCGHRLCGLLATLPCAAPHVLLYLGWTVDYVSTRTLAHRDRATMNPIIHKPVWNEGRAALSLWLQGGWL